ncbi:dmtf1, partial [Symbiodinium sp. KB8]
MAAAGSGRRARKRPRGDAGQPAPEPAQDGKELSAWQIADLPAAQSKLKRGVWSKAEDDLLRDLFNAECDARGMDEEAKKVRHAAVSTVAAVPAPDVILDSVNKHKAEGQGRFWVNISKHFTGKFSDEDIKELRHLVGIHGPKWKKIAQMMQRHPLVVRETYKAHAPGILHGPWSTSEEERLLSVMKEQGHVEKPGAVRIHWPAVASAVKSRCEAQCMSKWYSSFGLRERKHVWTPYADAVLLAHVVDDGEESWDHVDWHGVAAGVVHLLSSTGLAAADCRRRFRALCLRATKLVSRDVAALADKVEAYLRQTFEDPTLLDRARADAGLGSSGLGSSDPDTASDASASPAT